MAHPGGRPTKYEPAFCEKVHEYIHQNQDVWGEFHKTRGEKSDGYEQVVTVNLPTIEGFARYLGVHKSSIYEWKEKYKEFSDSLDTILDEQKQRLLNYGLSGGYNSTIAKLVLSSNHGMADKTENDNKHSGSMNLIGLLQQADGQER